MKTKQSKGKTKLNTSDKAVIAYIVVMPVVCFIFCICIFSISGIL